MSDNVLKHKGLHERGWSDAYEHLPQLIRIRGLRRGAEIGVAFGGHAERILQTTEVELLYGVDPFRHVPKYDDPMNLPQDDFDVLHRLTLERLAPFGNRYVHIRKDSVSAAADFRDELDFVYVDADHSYEGVWRDLCAWYSRVRNGGIISGHDYGHVNFPGIKQAVDRFFGRFEQMVTEAGAGVWWIEKTRLGVSFFIPAYNCAGTIQEAIESIVQTNLAETDELIVVNDGSTDSTADILQASSNAYPCVRVVSHRRNKGGGAARNTAIETARNPLLFCLDSDNILDSHSVARLREHLAHGGADAASFQEVRFFVEHPSVVTHTWHFPARQITLADCLAGSVTPPSHGNYLFTKASWLQAGGYPEFAGALDAWGFGFRQLASGAAMTILPDSCYFHRYGHESYWVRSSHTQQISLVALQIVLPYLELLEPKDADYITGRSGRHTWFERLDRRPLRVRSQAFGQMGTVLVGESRQISPSSSLYRRLKRSIGRLLP